VETDTESDRLLTDMDMDTNLGMVINTGKKTGMDMGMDMDMDTDTGH
jgi:hypothetical protein